MKYEIGGEDPYDRIYRTPWSMIPFILLFGDIYYNFVSPIFLERLMRRLLAIALLSILILNISHPFITLFDKGRKHEEVAIKVKSLKSKYAEKRSPIIHDSAEKRRDLNSFSENPLMLHTSSDDDQVEIISPSNGWTIPKDSQDFRVDVYIEVVYCYRVKVVLTVAWPSGDYTDTKYYTYPSEPFTAIFYVDVPDLGENEYSVEVRAEGYAQFDRYSDFEFIGSDSITIYYDRRAPRVDYVKLNGVNIYSTSGDITGSDLVFSWRVYDATFKSITVYLDGNRLFYSSSKRGSKTVSSDYEGCGTVEVVIRDAAGHVISFSRELNIDVHPPELASFDISGVELVGSSGTFYLTGTSFTVSWSVDEYDLDHFEVSVSYCGVDVDSYNGADTEGSWSFSIPDDLRYEEGILIITVVMVDWLGNSVQKTFSNIVIDNLAPRIGEFNINGVGENETLYSPSSTLTLGWTIYEEFLDYVVIYFQDEEKRIIKVYDSHEGVYKDSVIFTDGNFSASITLDISGYEGKVYAFLTVYDESGHYSTILLVFFIDEIAPYFRGFYINGINVSSSCDIFYLNNNDFIRVDVWDRYFENLTIVFVGDSEEFCFTFYDSSVQKRISYFSLPDGTYSVIIKVYDKAGNCLEKNLSLTIVIDNTPPSIANFLIDGFNVYDGKYYVVAYKDAMFIIRVRYAEKNLNLSACFLEIGGIKFDLTEDNGYLQAVISGLSTGNFTFKLYLEDMAKNYFNTILSSNLIIVKDDAVLTLDDDKYKGLGEDLSFGFVSTFPVIYAGLEVYNASGFRFTYVLINHIDASLHLGNVIIFSEDYYKSQILSNDTLLHFNGTIKFGINELSGMRTGEYRANLTLIIAPFCSISILDDYVYDPNPPSITLYPESDAVYSGTYIFSTGFISFNICISDDYLNYPYYVMEIAVYYNELIIYNDTVEVNRKDYYTLNLTGFENVYLKLFVRVYDPVNNHSYAECDLFIDTEQPTIIIYEPKNGSYINETHVILRWLLEDNLAFNNATIWIYGVKEEKIIILPSNNTGYLSISLDNGCYALIIFAYDLVGNFNSSNTIQFVVDTEPPSILVISPFNNTWLSDNRVNIEVYGEDTWGIKVIVLLVNGVQYSVGRDKIVDEILLDDGTWELVIRVEDFADNTALTRVYIYIDTKPPEITVSGLINNSVVRIVEFSWEIRDANLDQGYIIINGEGLHNTTGRLVLKQEGLYSVSFYAEDEAGNKKTILYVVEVDTTPPDITVSGPGNCSCVKQASLDWFITDYHSVSTYIYINGSLFSHEEEGTVSLFLDGFYNITILACDEAGNERRLSYYVIVDSTPPEIFVEGLVNNSVVREIAFSWYIYDENLLQAYTTVNDDVLRNASGSLRIVTEGYYLIAIYGLDSAGNVKEIVYLVEIDRTPPEIYVYGLSNASCVKFANFSWVFEDPNLNESLVIINNSLIITSEVGDYTLTENGMYNLTFMAIDKAGNLATMTYFIVIDVGPPVVIIKGLKNGTYARNVSFAWNVSDDNLANVFLEINGMMIVVNASGSYTLLDEGVYSIVIIATDDAGNSAQLQYNIVIDRTPPQLIIVSPENNTWASSPTIEIVAHAIDDNPKRILLYIDSELIIGNISELNFDALLSDGEHVVSILAVDLANNSAVARLIVCIDTSPPRITVYGLRNNSVVGGVNFSWIITEDHLKYAKLAVNGEERLINESGFLELLSDGNYIIVFEAIDYAGNHATVVYSIIIDVSPPIIYAFGVENDSWVNSEINLTIIIEDDHFLNALVYLNDTLYCVFNNDSIFLNLSLWNGYWILKIVARDEAWNTYSMGIIFHVDKLPPIINVISPHNDTIYGRSVLIACEVLEDNLGEFFIEVDGLRYNASVMNLNFSEGPHIVSFYAKDLAGNFNEKTVMFYVDATPPMVEIIGNGSFVYNHSFINLSLNITETATLIAVIDNETVFSANVSGLIMLNVTLSDGLHNLSLIVEDKYGNKGTYSFIIIVDTTPPDIQLGIKVERQELRLSLNAKDDVSGMSRIEILINGKLYALLDSPQEISIFLEPGVYSLKIIAYDVAGNKLEISKSIRIREDVSENTDISDLPENPSSGLSNDNREEKDDQIDEAMDQYFVNLEEKPRSIRSIFGKETPFLRFSFIMTALRMLAFVIIIFLRRYKKLVATLLSVILIWDFGMMMGIGIGNNGEKVNALRKLVKRTGFVEILNMEQKMVEASSLVGELSDLSLKDYEELPSDLKFIEKKSLKVRTAISKLCREMQGKTLTIVFSPGYNITTNLPNSKLLDLLYQFAETTSDGLLMLLGRYATISNLAYAIKLALFWDLNPIVIILTHANKIGILTKDSGGFLATRHAFEYVFEKHNLAWMPIRVIALYCYATEHPVTLFFAKRGAKIYALSGAPSGAELFRKVINLLFGGIWILKHEVRKYWLDDEGRLLLVVEQHDILKQYNVSIQNQSIYLIRAVRQMRMYLYDTYRNTTLDASCYGTNMLSGYGPDLYDSYTVKVRVSNAEWNHKLRSGIPQISLGDFYNVVDWSIELIKNINWLLTNEKRIHEVIEKLKTNISALSVLKEYSKIIDVVQQKIAIIREILSIAMSIKKKNHRGEIFGIWRNYRRQILKIYREISEFLGLDRVVQLCEKIVEDINELVSSKDKVLNARLRLMRGNYNSTSEALDDLLVLSRAIRLAFKLPLIKAQIKFIIRKIPGLKLYLTNLYAGIRSLETLRGSFILMIKGRILAKSIPYLDMIRALLKSLKLKWNRTIEIRYRLLKGDYEPSNNISEEILEDIKALEDTLEEIRDLRFLMLRILHLSIFYPNYTYLVREAKEYSDLSLFVKTLMRARSLLRDAELIENVMRLYYSYINHNIIAQQLVNESISAFYELNKTHLYFLKNRLEILFEELIRSYNKLMDYKSDLMRLKETLLRDRALHHIEMLSSPSWLVRYIASIETMINLIDLTRRYQDIIAEIDDLLTKLGELAKNTNDTEILQARDILAKLYRMKGELRDIILNTDKISKTAEMGFGELISTFATQLYRNATQSLSKISEKYSEFSLLLRARMLRVTYYEIVIPALSNSSHIFKPYILSRGDIREYKRELWELVLLLKSIIYDVDRIRNQARDEEYYHEIVEITSFKENATETLSTILGYWEIYNDLEELVDISEEIERNIDAVKTIMSNLSNINEIISHILNYDEMEHSTRLLSADNEILVNVTTALFELRYIEDEILENYLKYYDEDTRISLETVIQTISSYFPSLYWKLIESFREATYNLLRLEHRYSELLTKIPSNFTLAVSSYLNKSSVLEDVLNEAMLFYHPITKIPNVSAHLIKLWLYMDFARRTYDVLLDAFDQLDLDFVNYYRSLLKDLLTEAKKERNSLNDALNKAPALRKWIKLPRIDKKFESVIEEDVIEALMYILEVRKTIDYYYQLVIPFNVTLREVPRSDAEGGRNYPKFMLYLDDQPVIEKDEIEKLIDKIRNIIQTISGLSIDLGSVSLANQDLGKIVDDKIRGLAQEYNLLARKLDELRKIVELKDYIMTRNSPEMSQIELRSKLVLNEFATIDEILNTIIKAYGSFKMWLWKAIDQKVPWPGNEIVKAFLSKYMIGPIDALLSILNSDIAKSILAGVYYLMRSGATLMEIVAAAFAWLILKSFERILFLIGDALDFLLSFLPIRENFKDTVKDIVLGNAKNLANVAENIVIYIHERLADAMKLLMNAASSLLWVLEPVVIVLDAIREQIGEFLMNVYIEYAVPIIYTTYKANMTAALIDVIYHRERFLEKMGDNFRFLLYIGELAWRILPSSTKSEILSEYLDYAMTFGAYLNMNGEEIIGGEEGKSEVMRDASLNVLSDNNAPNYEKEDVSEDHKVKLNYNEISPEDAAKFAVLPKIRFFFTFNEIIPTVFVSKYGYNIFPVAGLLNLILEDGVFDYLKDDRGLTHITNMFLRITSALFPNAEKNEFVLLYNEIFGAGIDNAFAELNNEFHVIFNTLKDYTKILIEKVDHVLNTQLSNTLEEWFKEITLNHHKPKYPNDLLSKLSRLRDQHDLSMEIKRVLLHLETMIKLLYASAVYGYFLNASQSRIRELNLSSLYGKQRALTIYYVLRQVIEYLSLINHVVIKKDNEFKEVKLRDLTNELEMLSPNEAISRIANKACIVFVARDRYVIWRVNFAKIIRKHLKTIEMFRCGSESLRNALASAVFLSPITRKIRTIRTLLFRNLQFISLDNLLTRVNSAIFSTLIASPANIRRLIAYSASSEGIEGFLWGGIINLHGFITLKIRRGKWIWHPFIITSEYFGYRERDIYADDPLWGFILNFYIKLEDLQKISQIKFLNPSALESISVKVDESGELTIKIPGNVINWFRNFARTAQLDVNHIIELLDLLITFGIIRGDLTDELKNIINKARRGDAQAISYLITLFNRKLGSDERRALKAIYNYLSQFTWFDWLEVRGLRGFIKIRKTGEGLIKLDVPDNLFDAFTDVFSDLATDLDTQDIISMFGFLIHNGVIKGDIETEEELQTIVHDAMNGLDIAIERLRQIYDSLDKKAKIGLVGIYRYAKKAGGEVNIIEGIISENYLEWGKILLSLIISMILPSLDKLEPELSKIIDDLRVFFTQIRDFLIELRETASETYQKLVIEDPRLKNALIYIARELGIQIKENTSPSKILDEIVKELLIINSTKNYRELIKNLWSIIGYATTIKIQIMVIGGELSDTLREKIAKIVEKLKEIESNLANIFEKRNFIEVISQIQGLWRSKNEAIHINARFDFIPKYLSLILGLLSNLDTGSKYWKYVEYRSIASIIALRVIRTLPYEARKILAIEYLQVWKDFIFKFIRHFDEIRKYYRGEISDKELRKRPILKYLITIIEDIDSVLPPEGRRMIKRVSHYIREGAQLARIIIKLIGGTETSDPIRIAEYFNELEKQIIEGRLKTKKDTGRMGTGLKSILGETTTPRFSVLLISAALARMTHTVMPVERSIGLRLLMRYIYRTRENLLGTAIVSYIVELLRMRSGVEEHLKLIKILEKIVEEKTGIEDNIGEIIELLKELSAVRLRGIVPRVAYAAKALLGYLEIITMKDEEGIKFINGEIAETINRILRVAVNIDNLMNQLAKGEVKKEHIRKINDYLGKISDLRIYYKEESLIITEYIMGQKGRKKVKEYRKIAEIKMIREKNNEKSGIILISYHNHPLTEINLAAMASRIPEKRKANGMERLCYKMLPLLTAEIFPVINGEVRWHRGLSGAKALIHTINQLAMYIEKNYAEEKMLFKIIYQGIKKGKNNVLGLSEILKIIDEVISSRDKNKEELKKAEKSIESLLKEIFKKDENGNYIWKSTFNKLKLSVLDEAYRENLARELREILRCIENGSKNKLIQARERIAKMLNHIRALEIQLGQRTQEMLKIMRGILIPESTEKAKNAVRKINKMLREEKEEKRKAERAKLNSAVKLALTLLSIITRRYPDLLRIILRPTLSQELKHELKTGFITGLMSTIGAIVGNILLLTALEEGNTWILDFLNFEMPTIGWIIIQIIILLIMVGLLKKEIIGEGKLIATGIAGAAGILAYARENKKGILDKIPCHVLLSAVLWVWDEYDDFQDAWSRLKGEEGEGGLMDTLELLLLPFILGLFGAWMGIDQLLISTRIPGRWGFVKYVTHACLPEPWNIIANVAYEIAEFLIANVIASGARGIGWILYTIGSVLASMLINATINAVLNA